jgi:endonuclease/exonuclease/phosphatase family metal-dependent hydrolase
MTGAIGKVFATSRRPGGQPAVSPVRPAPGAPGPGRAGGSEVPLRILTYNIHKGYCSGNRRFVLEQMRQRIEETGADLAFLQEVHGHRVQDGRASYPDRPHFEYVADRAWPHYAYGRNAIYRNGDHGNAILSKFPIVGWENIDVAMFPRSSRSILHGVVQVPGTTLRLHVLCVHFGLLELERRGQIARVGRRIAEHVPAGEPLILAGDFNDWGRKAERYLHTSIGIDELFMELEGRHARTWPIRRPLLAMDRIYYRGVEPRACRVLSGGEWRSLSDHAALLGDFRLRIGSHQLCRDPSA